LHVPRHHRRPDAGPCEGEAAGVRHAGVPDRHVHAPPPEAAPLERGGAALGRTLMKPRILNVENVALVSRSHGDNFECQVAPVGRELDSKLIGFNVTIVPPGKKPFPYHAHRGNEEMFFVLDGEGSVRIDGATHKIRKGDFISLPPGRDSAHQIINDSKAPLRYLAVSTMIVPDVIEYPD